MHLPSRLGFELHFITIRSPHPIPIGPKTDAPPSNSSMFSLPPPPLPLPLWSAVERQRRQPHSTGRITTKINSRLLVLWMVSLPGVIPTDCPVNLRYVSVELMQNHFSRHIVAKLFNLFSDISEEGVRRPSSYHHNRERGDSIQVHGHRGPRSD